METLGMSSSWWSAALPMFQHGEEGQNPLQCSRGPQTPKPGKEFHFVQTDVRETQHRCTALTQTIFSSVLSLTWLQELSYSWDIAIWEHHLKGLLLAGTLCISMHRTFSAAVSVINSSSHTKLCHLSCSVGTAVVFSQVRISHFSE